MVTRSTINRILFDLTCQSETRAGQMRSEFAHYTSPVLYRLIDEILANACGESEHLIINKIEIDLGIIQSSFFGDPDALNRFQAALEEKVSAMINNTDTDDNHKVVSILDAEFDNVIQFLLTGTLDAWAGRDSDIDWDAVVKKLIAARPEALRTFLVNNRNMAYFMERLAGQFKQSTKEKLASLVPSLRGALTGKLNYTDLEYEVQLRKLPASILQRFNSNFRGRFRTNQGTKTLRLQKLLNQTYTRWYKQLEILNILTGEELEKLHEVYRNRTGKQGRMQVLKILNKLSIFQIEFLLYLSLSQRGFKMGETDQTEFESAFGEDLALNKDNVYEVDLDPGRSKPNEISAPRFNTVNWQSPKSDSFDKNINKVFPAVTSGICTNNIRNEDHESSPALESAMINRTSTGVDLTGASGENMIGVGESNFVNRGNGKTADSSKSVIAGEEEYNFLNRGNQDNITENSNAGEPVKVKASSPDVRSKSNQQEQQELFDPPEQTSSVSNAKLASISRGIQEGQSAGITQILFTKRDREEPSTVNFYATESDRGKESDENDGNSISPVTTASPPKVTSLATDWTYDSTGGSSAIKVPFINFALDKVKVETANQWATRRLFLPPSDPSTQDAENPNAVKPVAESGTNKVTAVYNSHTSVDEDDERDHEKLLNLRSAPGTYEDGTGTGIETPNTSGARKIQQEVLGTNSSGDNSGAQVSKNESSLSGNREGEQTDNFATTGSASKNKSQRSDLGRKEIVSLEKHPSAITQYSVILQALHTDLFEKTNLHHKGGFANFEKHDKGENQLVTDSYRTVSGALSNEEITGVGGFADHASDNTEVLKGEQRVAQINFIINKLGKAGSVFHNELQLLSDHDLLVLETQFRQFEQLLRKRKQMVEAILEHPYLFRYDLLKLLSVKYTTSHADAKERNPEFEQKTISSKSSVRSFFKRISSAHPAFINAINNLSSRDLVVLKDVLRKQVFETVSERKTIKRILKKLPEETIDILHQFTQLAEADMDALASFALKNPAIDEGHKIGVPLFPQYRSQSSKFYVDNAGLCLIAAYFPILFKNLGYLEGDAFRNKASLLRALYLIEYIANGRARSAEFQLTLNKVICGISTAENVPANIRLTKKEKAEADELLESVIENWEAIKNTSLNGFRGSFLQRNGILTENELSWTLQVETKSFDMLLSTISWGFGIIKLPWMKKHIQIEW